MLLACSGGSNVGQAANRAVVELTQEGYGKMYCLAGIGGGLSGFIQSARDVDRMVVIDGCPVGCARAALERADVPLRGYLVVTELGIAKSSDLEPGRPEVERVKAAALDTGSLSQMRGKGDSTETWCCSGDTPEATSAGTQDEWGATS